MKKIEKLMLMNREELLYFLQNIGCPPDEDMPDGSCEDVQSCLECWKKWGEMKVQVPHGRLIDAEKLIEAFEAPGFDEAWWYILNVENAPTVVPAEEDSNG